MAKYVEALDVFDPTRHAKNSISVFLGGGISGCADWQQEMTDLLSSTNLIILNPRRKNFPINDPTQSEVQIKWEYEHLKKATIVVFWFPPTTLCPITLFELGTFAKSKTPLLVGTDPAYKRKFDVRFQMSLYRPDVEIVESVKDLSVQIKTLANLIKSGNYSHDRNHMNLF